MDPNKVKGEASSGNSSGKRKSRRSKKPKEPVPRLKLVIRKLPPNLPKEVFLKTVEPWINKIDWHDYYPGKLSKRYVVINRLRPESNNPAMVHAI
jgi:regulator of nonsense transcripts 3